MCLTAMPEAGGTQREFPALNEGAIPREWPEKIGLADIAVVQPILGACLEGVGVERPAAVGNGDAELMLFITLAAQRAKRQVLTVGQIEKWTGRRQERRRLIKITIEGSKYPIQMRDFDGDADARIRCILDDLRLSADTGRVEVRLAEAGDDGQPRSHFETVAEKGFGHTTGHRSRGRTKVLAARAAASRKNVIEVIVLALRETVDAGFEIIFPECRVQCRLHAAIIRGLVHVCDHGHVVWRAGVAGFVVMVEGRNSEEQIWVERVYPGKSDVTIRLALTIAKTVTGISLIPGRIGIGIVRDLVIILAQGGDESKLVI